MEKTILLVDDEEDIRMVLALALKDLGYRVIMAENGREGLRLFREEHPPVVITDIKMPDINGVELLRRIKQENPETEVVMITGHGDMSIAVESFHSDASDFITKPINVDSLEKSLKKVEEKIATRRMLSEYTRKLEGLIYEKSMKLSEFAQTPLALTGGLTDMSRKFKAFVDDMPFFLAIHDRDNRITAANRRFVEEFGDIIGSYCYQSYKKQDQPCPDCPVSRTISDGNPRQVQGELVLTGGTTRDVLVWTSPIRDSSGDVTHAVMMAVENRQLVTMTDRLSTLGLLMGSVSHSIKGLLTGLDGGLYLLESGLQREQKEKMTEGLNIVKAMAGRIRGMVLDVLMSSKERDLKLEKILVRSFVLEILDVIRPKADEYPIEVASSIRTDVEDFRADPGFLRTALVNILENALDACRADQEKPARRIDFQVTDDPENIVFSIRDNGIGMDEETRDNMFNLFFSKKGKQGTGLGMYVSDRIVRQHGGEIEVASTPGQGTDVTVFIPRHHDDDDDYGHSLTGGGES